MVLLIGCLLLFLVIIFVIAVGNKYNGANWGHPATNILDGWLRLYCKKYQRQGNFEIIFPDDGKLILASNHLSAIDPLLLVAASSRPIRFMIAKEEYERPILHWMFRAAGCIPVNRVGRVDGAFKRALRAINAGEIVAIFPQGGIHSESTPRTRIKPGIIKLSQLTGCTVLPVRIGGISAPGTMLECIVKRGHITFDVSKPITSEQVQSDDFNQSMSNWLLGKTDYLDL